MRIDVTQYKGGMYELKINDEMILKHPKLSSIVSKIEQYLKMRFLAENKTGGLGEKLKGLLE